MIDFEEILAVAEGYEARMKIVREHFDRREPVPEKYTQYLAALSDGEAVKAFEALRPLVERVRVLERQREILAGKIGTLTRWYDAMAGCEVCEFTQDCDNSEACCTNAIIQWAEEAAKEAGECLMKC